MKKMEGTKIAFQVDDIDLAKIRSEGISWEDVSNEIESLAGTVSTRLSAMASKPKETEVQFGLSVGMKGGLVVVTGDASASIKVTLKW